MTMPDAGLAFLVRGRSADPETCRRCSAVGSSSMLATSEADIMSAMANQRAHRRHPWVGRLAGLEAGICASNTALGGSGTMSGSSTT